MSKFYIDTANLQEIEDTISKGFVSGITTNPSLLAKEPATGFYPHIKKIIEICKQHDNPSLSVEVFAKEPEKMLNQAMSIYDELEYSNLSIKIPIGYEELNVVSELAKRGIGVNVTCCFTEQQMLFGEMAGAKYVSLFYNRLKDFGGDPNQVLQNVSRQFDKSFSTCKIIVGSIRKDYDVVNSWNNGGDIVTAGYKLFPTILEHPMTDYSVEGFLRDFDEWIN